MAINYGANYTGIDKERYDAGNQFYSQDRFLQGTGLDKPAITFNPSNYDTGITSQYGNNSMYGTPNQGGDSMGATMPIGNFNDKGNLFPTPSVPYENELSFQGKVPGMDTPAINFKDAPVDFMLRQNNPRVFDPLVNTKNAIQNFDMSKVRDYGIKGLASKMLSQGGAGAGFSLFGLPGAIAGMLGGAKLGFGARGPTDAERVTANFYGNQGNSPMQYLDEEGNLVDSMMQGYNISSAYGGGIANALQGRIDRINKTISNPNYRGQLKVRRDGKKSLLDKLLAEQKALEAATQAQANNMQDSNRAMGTGGYQAGYSDDFMEGPDPSASNQDLTSTMGSR